MAEERVTSVAARVGQGIVAQTAERYSMEPGELLSTIRKTIIAPKKVKVGTAGEYKFVEASMEEVLTFLQVAKEYALNPFTKEVVGFVAGRGQVVPYVTIDGWISLINRNKRYGGLRALPLYDDNKKLFAYTVIGRVKDAESPTGYYEVEITEQLIECKRNTEPWETHPSRMLRHKAIIQWARVAFGYSGLYDQDEAERILEAEENRNAIDVTDAGKSLMPQPKLPATAPPKPAVSQPAPQESAVQQARDRATQQNIEKLAEVDKGVQQNIEDQQNQRQPGEDEGEGEDLSGALGEPEPQPEKPKAKDEKSMTDDEKRLEISLHAKKYAAAHQVSDFQAVKEFSQFEAGGDKIATGDINKLKGTWLNTTLGKARKMTEGL